MTTHKFKRSQKIACLWARRHTQTHTNTRTVAQGRAHIHRCIYATRCIMRFLQIRGNLYRYSLWQRNNEYEFSAKIYAVRIFVGWGVRCYFYTGELFYLRLWRFIQLHDSHTIILHSCCAQFRIALNAKSTPSIPLLRSAVRQLRPYQLTHVNKRLLMLTTWDE